MFDTFATFDIFEPTYTRSSVADASSVRNLRSKFDIFTTFEHSAVAWALLPVESGPGSHQRPPIQAESTSRCQSDTFAIFDIFDSSPARTMAALAVEFVAICRADIFATFDIFELACTNCAVADAASVRDLRSKFDIFATFEHSAVRWALLPVGSWLGSYYRRPIQAEDTFRSQSDIFAIFDIFNTFESPPRNLPNPR